MGWKQWLAVCLVIGGGILAYPEGEGFVTYDTTMTSVTEIVEELERLTDFTATERAEKGG